MYLTAQFTLEIFKTLFPLIPVTTFGITMSSQHMHLPSHNFTGQSILSTLAILLHQSALVTFHSMWHLLATHLHMDKHLWSNLRLTNAYFSARQPCWTTFGDQATNQPLMATWFTHINSSPTNQPVHFEHYKLQLSLNCMLYNPYHCLLHLFTQITTAVASCILSTTFPKLDGLHHLHAWISQITAIQLLDTLPLLLASTTLLNHWWKNTNSKLHPANCHYNLIHSFGGTSTKWNTVSPMDVRMMTSGRNHVWASPHPFHLSQYLPWYQTVSNLCISFTQMDQIPQYWQVWWLSLGTVCAPLSPLHLTVTSSNPTMVCQILCQWQAIRAKILPIWVHFLLLLPG